MKKLFILLISLIFLTANFCFALNSYDYYGQKTGSYKQNGTTINQYDKYGQKTGSYKQTTNGYNSYDKYGQKTGGRKKGTPNKKNNGLN